MNNRSLRLHRLRCRGGALIQQGRTRAIVLLLLSLLAAGCSRPAIEPLMPTPVLFSSLGVSPLDHIPEHRRWNPRRVYYATTRARQDNLQRIDYGNREADAVSVGMTLIGFGGPTLSWSDLRAFSRVDARPKTVDLSIAGLVEIGTFKPGSDGGEPTDPGGSLSYLLADLNNAIDSAGDRDLLVYVHGAKVNFYNASAFAAQLDHFMGRDMTSIAFSWPTRQSLLAYGSGADVERAYRAAPALASLLRILAQESVARRIHLVSWSAGGRVVTAALQQLYAESRGEGEELRKRFRLGTVYYAAADVPGEVFLTALPAINALASRIVVTVSSRDGALEAASRFMGGGRRIGQRVTDLPEEDAATVAAAGRLEVIDVSRNWEGRGFDITGHRYWVDHPWASSDLVLAVRSDLDPDERGLQASDIDFLWSIPADYPDRLRRKLTRSDLRLRSAD